MILAAQAVPSAAFSAMLPEKRRVLHRLEPFDSFLAVVWQAVDEFHYARPTIRRGRRPDLAKKAAA